MTKSRGALIFVSITAILIGLWKWKHSEPSAPAKPSTPQAPHVGSATPAATDDKQPAHVIVTVKDAKGPLAHAIVRLVADGEVTIVHAGTDGVAKTDVEPAKWTVSASAADHEPMAAAARELHAGETATFTIELAAGGRALSGTVTDATGGPVSGARIDAAKLSATVRPSDAVASTTTGADGKYTLTVAEGQLLVAASSADYAPQARYVEVGPSGATVDFRLVPGGVIEGIVRDEGTRQPVAGATVLARRDSPSMMFGEIAQHRATSGADGRFRMTGLRPGSYELGANAPKLSSHSPTVVGLGVAEQVTDVEILVGGGPVIRGVVVDEVNTPVPQVTVAPSEDDAVHATTDAKGAFTLEGLDPGHYGLVAMGGDFVPFGRTAVELGTKDVDGVRVVVRRGIKLKGHVEPRQICSVKLDLDDHELGPDLPMMGASVSTTAEGEFAIGPLSPVEYKVDARCPSGDQGSLTITMVAGLPDQIVHVDPGASVAGRVVDSSGKPVVAVTVMATPRGNAEHTTIINGMVTSGVQGLTNAGGAYEVRGLGAGTYRLSVLDRGRPVPMKSPEAKTKVTLAAKERKTGVELAIDRADGVIRGTVTDPDGKPLADAWVSAHQDLGDLIAGMEPRDSPEGGESRFVTIRNEDDGGGGGAGEIPPALTDATGHFEIGGLTRTPWLVVAEAQAGKLRGRTAHVTPDATITIQASGVTELHGIVHAGGLVPAFDVELEGPTRAARTFATADGSFSFARVDPGDYTVRVTSSAGHGEAHVQVVAGKQATVDITLSQNAIVIGKIVDAAGKPVGGIPITVVADNGDGQVRVSLQGPPPMSGPDGNFRVETKAGKSILVVMTPPKPVTKMGLVLEAGKTLDVGPIAISGPPPKP